MEMAVRNERLSFWKRLFRQAPKPAERAQLPSEEKEAITGIVPLRQPELEDPAITRSLIAELKKGNVGARFFGYLEMLGELSNDVPDEAQRFRVALTALRMTSPDLVAEKDAILATLNSRRDEVIARHDRNNESELRKLDEEYALLELQVGDFTRKLRELQAMKDEKEEMIAACRDKFSLLRKKMAGSFDRVGIDTGDTIEKLKRYCG